MSGRAVRPAHRATTRTKPPLPCASAGQELFGGVLLQSGAGGARTLIDKAVHNPVALISQAPVKALATITASGFGHPKANTLPSPLRSACIASIPCSVPYADTGFLNPPPLGPRIRLSRP